ncbi:GGDEF domain-containing protein [Marinobacterium arenosum]|uniref:GGDEF domain-containing protein n=1 Tax=Marinobacterium arenosum TaxID=2862496 RepID=UPI001C94007F|nr:GGDEF domain-containing protein [Marinobacterium arenosum]MBY4675554.1 GGDEF domain-containing protein [Marinobacterium arenosum]
MVFEALLDVVTAGRHSRYFNHARSHHLYRRIRVIALLMGLLQPAWVLVDALLLPADILAPIALCRALSGGLCLVLAAWYHSPYDLRLGYLRLLLLVGLLSAFQTASTSLLIQAGYGNQVAGYHFFPFMIICMMAVFPLTILEVIVFAGGVLLLELSTQLMRDSFGQIGTLNDLWLLSVLGAIAGWAAVNQLNMLLGLFRQATRDPLTGLSNRRQLMEQLGADLASYRSHGKPLSVLMFDLDHFKQFNDQHGHAAGDIVLRTFAKLMRRHCRKKLDLAGRYGGEEFLMVLPGLDAGEARQVAEAIRNGCHGTQVLTPSGEKIGFTTSIGLASVRAGDDIDDLLKRADEALYEAKGSGRDRVQIAA